MTRDKIGDIDNNGVRWERARDLVRSQQWKWVANAGYDDPLHAKTPGIMQCEVTNLPTEKTTQDILDAIRQYTDLEPLCMQGAKDVISIPCPRLVDFQVVFGSCYSQQTTPVASHEPTGPNREKRIEDHVFSFSRKGHDIYVFLAKMSELNALRGALSDNGITKGAIHLMDNQYRLTIPASQQTKLEALGVCVLPYSRKQQASISP